jgi:hypothetical protein
MGMPNVIVIPLRVGTFCLHVWWQILAEKLGKLAKSTKICVNLDCDIASLLDEIVSI